MRASPGLLRALPSHRLSTGFAGDRFEVEEFERRVTLAHAAAQLGPGVTTIDVHVTMGNVEIVVPPGVVVDVDASSLLGNVEDRTEGAATATSVLRVTGRVALGNLEITTLLRGETKRGARRRRRWERRSLRKRLRAAERRGLPAPFDW